MLDNQQNLPSYSHSAYFSLSDIGTVPTYAYEVDPIKLEVYKVSDFLWEEIIQKEEPLKTYPNYSWRLELDSGGLPKFENYYTISRYLNADTETTDTICPFGDQPAPIARIEKINQFREVRNAYALSALRFELSPFKHKKSTEENKLLGIPTALKSLYQELISGQHPANAAQFLKGDALRELTLQGVKDALEQLQQKTRFRYIRELVPCMNANPFDPQLHGHELSPAMRHDLSQYVQLQNSPCKFFDLMQWLERDVFVRRWRSYQVERPLSIEEAIVLVMTSWRDQDGHRRKKPITCPIGVPLGYMQSIRRKDQPFITQEFSNHAHGALNHWLQEHVWQRFCDRYPQKHQLPPSEFFKQLGYSHLAFADAIYELHMPNLANPANTNFWSVLQYYLPFMSPWP